MSQPRIEPHKITTPIQLMAVWFAALVLLVAALLGAAALISSPTWMPATLSIAAILLIPAFVFSIFVMQTRYRRELQEDSYYSKWLKRQEVPFRRFKPELTGVESESKESQSGSVLSIEDPECQRIAKYQANKGLFLVHIWRPSITSGQVADIIIWVTQHGEGPLTNGQVERVEYVLGPKFSHAPIEKVNRTEKFKLEISAYGPVLCLARVYLRDVHEPICLERYIDFEASP